MYKIKIKVRVFMNLPLLHVNGILKHILSNQYKIQLKQKTSFINSNNSRPFD